MLSVPSPIGEHFKKEKLRAVYSKNGLHEFHLDFSKYCFLCSLWVPTAWVSLPKNPWVSTQSSGICDLYNPCHLHCRGSDLARAVVLMWKPSLHWQVTCRKDEWDNPGCWLYRRGCLGPEMTWIIDKVVLGKEPQLFIYYFWSKCVPFGTLSSSFECVRGLGVGKLGVPSFPCTVSGTLDKCMPGSFNKKAPKYHLNTVLSMYLSHVVEHLKVRQRHQRQLPGWSHSGRELEGFPSTLKMSEGETDKDFKRTVLVASII